MTNWAEYWKTRWAEGKTGWHQSDPEPGMVSFFSGLEKMRVLVPLCGKSKDLIWFLSQGHEVIGVELSQFACENFFKENQIPFEQKDNKFIGPGITIFNQDFFATTFEQIGKIDAVYDRAALIALPPELRKRYASHLTSLVHKRATRFCQIILERVPHDSEGPPFSVTQEEIQALYGMNFSIQLISKELVESDANKKLFESVLSLS